MDAKVFPAIAAGRVDEIMASQGRSRRVAEPRALSAPRDSHTRSYRKSSSRAHFQ